MKSKNEKAKRIQNIYSLTPLQEGMLFHHLSSPESSEYVLQDYYNVNAELDTGLIESALELLAMKHDVLRTAILYEKLKEPKQVVHRERKIEFIAIDLSSYSEDSQEEKISEIINSDLKRGFDLQKDTLVRFSYIKLNGKSKLLCTMHHIIVDGWCSGMITGGFISYYKALSKGTSVEEMKRSILQARVNSAE